MKRRDLKQIALYSRFGGFFVSEGVKFTHQHIRSYLVHFKLRRYPSAAARLE
jgi:hypothetical protein